MKKQIITALLITIAMTSVAHAKIFTKDLSSGWTLVSDMEKGIRAVTTFSNDGSQIAVRFNLDKSEVFILIKNDDTKLYGCKDTSYGIGKDKKVLGVSEYHMYPTSDGMCEAFLTNQELINIRQGQYLAVSDHNGKFNAGTIKFSLRGSDEAIKALLK